MTAEPTTREEEPALDEETKEARPPAPGEMTILEHLRELRNRTIVSVLAIIVGVVLCLFFWETILGWMLAPARNDPDIGGEEFRVASFSPLDRIGVAFKIGIFGGLAVASPVIIYQTLAFVMPALTPREKRTLFVGLIPIVAFLLGGMAFAYWMVLPASLGFLLNFGGDQIDSVIGIKQYTDFVIRIVFFVGISFELPVVMALAARLGMVRAIQYLRFWRYALVFVAIATAIITPTPDAITFTYVGVPLLLLYFLGIGFAWLVQPRHRAMAT